MTTGESPATDRSEQPDPAASRLKMTMTVLRAGEVEAPLDVQLSTPEVVVMSSDGIRDGSRIQYRPVGRCIYCGRPDDLHREHIIPFGLNGTLVLPQASCRECARKTSMIEARVLRGPMRNVRILRRFRSRSRHAGACHLHKLKTVKSGVVGAVELPIEESPILLYFPVFAPPRALTGQEGTGADVIGVDTLLFGPRPEDVARRLGVDGVSDETEAYDPIAFAQMVGKIAYATAAAERALGRLLGKSPAVPAILGDIDEIGRWVGSLSGPSRKYPGILHRVEIRADPVRKFLVAEVQLFADSSGPRYGVILGGLREAVEDRS